MNKQNNIEFRFYEIPQNEPILALVGDRWKKNYGHDVKYFHFHNLLEIGYCYYGSGKIMFGNDEFEFSDEMVSIIPKNLSHHTISDGDSISYWEFFYIDTDNLIKEMCNDNLVMDMEMRQLINKKAWLLNAKSNMEIVSLLLNIRNEMVNKRKYYKESVSEMLKSLLYFITRLYYENYMETKFTEKKCIDIKNALNYVEELYYKQIKIVELAAECNMSETNFRRIFLKQMNMSPLQYVNLVRVQKACDLLRSSELSIELTSERVGFLNVSTFIRNFKRIVGVSPYHWKLQLNKYEGKSLNIKITALKGW